MLAEGQIIGNYRIVRKLGEGGMGAVFEAVHQEIGRRAAVKVLHPQFAQNAQVATRFLNEAKAANLIEHPGVVEIFEFSRLPDGTTYIVMEFLKGEGLSKRLERGPLGLETLRITRQIASVLAAAHEHGIVHRDLKPDNVIIVKDPEAPGGERAKVLDFGIAKIAEEHTMKTQAGSVLGTPLYMAPEQCKSASLVSDKSDVYALGIMMYEMLSGQVPFNGEGLGEIMVAHLTQEPPPLSQTAPDTRPELAAFVHRMLAKEPAERPSMREVIDQLAHLGAPQTGVLMIPTGSEFSGRYNLSPTGSISVVDSKHPSNTSTQVRDSQGGTTGTGVAQPGAPNGSSLGKKLLFAGLGISVLGMAAAVAYVLLHPPPPPPPPPKIVDLGVQVHVDASVPKEAPKPPPPPEPRKPKGPVPAGMAFVPGGRFEMGSTDAEIDAGVKLCLDRGIQCKRAVFERELPRRTVTVRDIFIDQTEVSNAQFAAWLNRQSDFKVKKNLVYAGKTLLVDLDPVQSGIEYSKPTSKGGGFQVRSGFAEKPAVKLTWAAAQRYCTGNDKRLPTEAEWELAARGTERRTFPWGEGVPKCSGTVFGRDPLIPQDYQCAGPEMLRGPENVGTAVQDKTPQGVFDLGGNVAEWVQDIFAEHYPKCTSGCKNPVNEEANEDGPPVRVLRGGHFDLAADACRGAGRSKLLEDKGSLKLGFRCARSAPE